MVSPPNAPQSLPDAQNDGELERCARGVREQEQELLESVVADALVRDTDVIIVGDFYTAGNRYDCFLISQDVADEEAITCRIETCSGNDVGLAGTSTFSELACSSGVSFSHPGVDVRLRERTGRVQCAIKKIMSLQGQRGDPSPKGKKESILNGATRGVQRRQFGYRRCRSGHRRG